jgi:hypothetical protein
MDSIYILDKEKSAGENYYLCLVMQVAVEMRLKVVSMNYLEGYSMPIVRVLSSELYPSELEGTCYPEIEFSIFEKSSWEDSNDSQIIEDGLSLVHVISLRCRESLFLLDFLLRVMLKDEGFRALNVENTVLSLDQLIVFQKEMNVRWAYL